MALLGRLSGVFERMNKKIVKSKDLTPITPGQQGMKK